MLNITATIKAVIYQKFNYYTRYGLAEDELVNIGMETYLNYKDETITDKQMMNKIAWSIRKYLIEYQKYSNIRQMDIEAMYDTPQCCDIELKYGEDPATLVQYTNELDEVYAAIEDLTPRSQFVIRSLYLTEQPKTLEEVGRDLEISITRVAQIRDDAEAKLSEMLGNK